MCLWGVSSQGGIRKGAELREAVELNLTQKFFWWDVNPWSALTRKSFGRFVLSMVSSLTLEVPAQPLLLLVLQLEAHFLLLGNWG